MLYTHDSFKISSSVYLVQVILIKNQWHNISDRNTPQPVTTK